MNVRANIELSDRSWSRAESLVLPLSPSPATPSRRIVTLASLSRMVPDPLIGNVLAQFTRSETEESVLLVRIGAGESDVSLRDFAAIQPTLNGEFCFAAHLRNGEGGFKRLDLGMTGEPGELSFVKPLLQHLSGHFRYILLRVGADASDQVLFECLTHSDQTYLFLRQSQENLYDFDLLLREARARFNGDCSRLKTVLCLAEGEPARMSSELAKKLGGPPHAFVHDCPPSVADAENHWAAINAGISGV